MNTDTNKNSDEYYQQFDNAKEARQEFDKLYNAGYEPIISLKRKQYPERMIITVRCSYTINNEFDDVLKNYNNRDIRDGIIGLQITHKKMEPVTESLKKNYNIDSQTVSRIIKYFKLDVKSSGYSTLKQWIESGDYYKHIAKLNIDEKFSVLEKSFDRSIIKTDEDLKKMNHRNTVTGPLTEKLRNQIIDTIKELRYFKVSDRDIISTVRYMYGVTAYNVQRTIEIIDYGHPLSYSERKNISLF